MNKYCLWLNHFRNLSVREKHLLINTIGSPEQLYEELDSRMVELLVDKKVIKEDDSVSLLTERGQAWFDDYFEMMEKNNVHWMTPEDELYPERLKNIYDMPLVLFYKGNPEIINDEHMIAIVGTRTPSVYGKEIAKLYAERLSVNGVTIVSGLAFGVDGIAHRGCIEMGGRTAAVLGCGVNICYPQSNLDIYERILYEGILLSEFGPEVKPLSVNFPMRNRIISGLSDALLVIEAKNRSGTLITADCALEQGRTVFSVPGRIGDLMSEGTNNLIRQGAQITTKPEDVLESMNIISGKRKKKAKRTMLKLNPEEQKIIDNLGLMPIYMDDIICSVRGTVSGTISVLAGLEKKGLVEQSMPGYYRLKSEV